MYSTLKRKSRSGVAPAWTSNLRGIRYWDEDIIIVAVGLPPVGRPTMKTMKFLLISTILSLVESQWGCPRLDVQQLAEQANANIYIFFFNTKIPVMTGMLLEPAHFFENDTFFQNQILSCFLKINLKSLIINRLGFVKTSKIAG